LRETEESYEEWRKNKPSPFATSFVNVFPKGNQSYIIAGYHKDYQCRWTDNLLNRIKRNNRDRIFKELSDLITLRLEFWAMSPKLFKTISKTELEKYKLVFSENVFNHSPKLKTKINLFRNYQTSG
jgi:hypothetical protein